MLLYICLALFTCFVIVNITLSRRSNPKKKKRTPRMSRRPAAEATSNDHSTLLSDLGYEIPAEESVVPIATEQQQEFDLGSPQDLQMIYLVAPKNRPYLGYELIQALLASGLRHGAMGLFHYHDDKGRILFSVAQTTETGSFDLDKMGGITCRGLILFLPKTAPQSLFANMIEIANELADELGGQLLNADHQPLGENLPA